MISCDAMSSHSIYDESSEPTRYAVICPEHGRVYLTREAYGLQMNRPTEPWECPRFVAGDPMTMGPCGSPSEFDHFTFEGHDQ